MLSMGLAVSTQILTQQIFNPFIAVSRETTQKADDRVVVRLFYDLLLN